MVFQFHKEDDYDTKETGERGRKRERESERERERERERQREREKEKRLNIVNGAVSDISKLHKP